MSSMFQVAIYGKGGIGKSTMAANISYSLASRGRKVMQVGCDPKHDSTRQLLGGRAQTTVLDYARSVPVLKRKLEDVIETGAGGVICAEAGGPEPGIGCAGRGILTTFDTLKKLGADSLDVDIKIYDVLGDVVCGGFAVPLRGEYADAVVLVTSGEFMSMYAANNIMKGLSNFDTGKPRLLGMILNCRGVEHELESVGRFAEAAGVPIIAVIPRDYSFREAEAKGATVRELFPDSDISARIDSIADAISQASDGKAELRYPHPLDDLQLTDLAAGREIRPGSGESQPRVACSGCGRRTSIKGTRIMSSCAAYGAVAAFTRLTDYTVLIHGPRSCMYLMDMSRGSISMKLHSKGAYDTLPTHNLRCTMMDDSVSIFGGVRLLEESLEESISEGCDKIAVVTACMPGIIGDDSVGAIEKVSSKHPGTEICCIQTDGDVAGSFDEGMAIASEFICGLIDASVKPERGLVNLVSYSFFNIESSRYRSELGRILSLFGLSVNCRFLDETTSERVRDFCRASIDLLVSGDKMTAGMMASISERTGRKPFPLPLPVGMRQYSEWLRLMGETLGMEEAAETELKRAEEEYGRFLADHRHRFEGKKAIVLNRRGDWLAELLDDLGAEIVRMGMMSGLPRTYTTSSDRLSSRITEDYSWEMLAEDLRQFDPDLLISDLPYPVMGRCRVARTRKVGIGIIGAMDYAVYLENVMRLPPTEGRKEAVK